MFSVLKWRLVSVLLNVSINSLPQGWDSRLTPGKLTFFLSQSLNPHSRAMAICQNPRSGRCFTYQNDLGSEIIKSISQYSGPHCLSKSTFLEWSCLKSPIYACRSSHPVKQNTDKCNSSLNWMFKVIQKWMDNDFTSLSPKSGFYITNYILVWITSMIPKIANTRRQLALNKHVFMSIWLNHLCLFHSLYSRIV